MAFTDDDDLKVVASAASVRRQVEDQLRRAIVQGRFPPGEHLSDRVLTDRFQVSRSVVREAIRQLEAEGLVETFPYRGSFVRTLTVREAEQVYAVRGVLEALAAKEFARRATDAQIALLEESFQPILNFDASRPNQELIDLKQKFYDVLLAGCGNTYIRTMLSQLLNVNARLRATSLSAPGRLPQMVAELEALMAALRVRDQEAAWRASLAHVENAAAVALNLLRQRTVAAGPDRESTLPSPARTMKIERSIGEQDE
jgi:DNA-binding GntR family transcriptional regulator